MLTALDIDLGNVPEPLRPMVVSKFVGLNVYDNSDSNEYDTNKQKPIGVIKSAKLDKDGKIHATIKLNDGVMLKCLGLKPSNTDFQTEYQQTPFKGEIDETPTNG